MVPGVLRAFPFRYHDCRSRGLHRSPCFFFFNDTATTEIYTLSLHDALPILADIDGDDAFVRRFLEGGHYRLLVHRPRSEEHTSELQSRRDLVCRLLLEK